MQYFIDSANPEKIKKTIEYFPVAGVTTNPTIIAREKAELLPLLKILREITCGKTLFVQVTEKDAERMVSEAEKFISSLGGNLCIKIPATKEGLKAIKSLSAKGVNTTATAVYSVQQALLCAAAGAKYVAPYMSHIDNLCVDSVEVAGEMARLFEKHFPQTHVLAASFRVAEQINRVIMAGVDSVTIAPEMFDTLISNAQTNAELASFEKNWDEVYGDKTAGNMIGEN